MLPKRLVRVAFLVSAVIAVACGDPTLPRATYASAITLFTLYPLTGSPPNTLNAISFLGGAVRASSTFNFDVAVDLDASGNVAVYPVRTVYSALAGSLKRVGMQIVPGGFNALREVPSTGYDTVNVQTLTPGVALAIEMRDATSCFSYALVTSQLLYAKLVVDSVNAATRRIYGRIVFDPNCGYRQVVPDSVPTG